MFVLRATLKCPPVVAGACDFRWLGGSMCSVGGEKFARAAELALAEQAPLVCFSATGGARMQEGLLSLMQMAKTTSMLTKLSDAKLPFISILTDPTMGGVSASFAFMGDIVMAEPKALIGLAGLLFRKVAIGVPASVPVGRYTRSVLEKAKLWQVIEAKMIGAQNVRQALDYVARGEVDAGFVYGTDAAIMRDKVKVAFVVPTDKPVLYPIAPVAATQNMAAAQKFVAFVVSPAGQSILATYGFGKP